MRRFDGGDPFAEKREQRDKTADLLREQLYAHMAVHEPEKYAAEGIVLDEYSHPPFATAALLAYELDVAAFPVQERLSRVLQYGRDTGRLTQSQSDELFHKLVDIPLGVWPDAERMRSLAGIRNALGKLRASWEAFREGKASLGASLCQEAAETASRAGNGRRRVTDGAAMVTRWLDGVINPRPERRITFALPALNAAIGYASPGEVLVVGGATNVGKSTFILEMIIGAIEQSDKIGHISTEDDEERTIRRMVSAYSGVSVLDLKLGRGMERATVHAQRVKDIVGSRYFFSDARGMNDLEVCKDMTDMARLGARTIVVDYIQSVGSSNDRQDRRNEIASIMTMLKAHATRIGVLLIIVSQFSRPRDGRPQEPTLHDLKEAGELENMADNVLLVSRDRENANAPMKVKLAKSKDGGTGACWSMRRASGSGRLVQCEAEIVPFPGPRRR